MLPLESFQQPPPGENARGSSCVPRADHFLPLCDLFLRSLSFQQINLEQETLSSSNLLQPKSSH
jgi:hypothetical protein